MTGDLRRVTGWRTHLNATLERYRGEPFAWDGKHDCGMFFADCIKAMTGFDIAAPLRGKYRSKAGAFRALRGMGFDDHVDYVASILPEIDNPAMARAGDGAVVTAEDGPALAIVTGPLTACYAPSGLGFIEFGRATRAFRIG